MPKPSDFRILIAQDDQNMRHILATRLESHGYHVIEAGTGAEAVLLASGPENQPLHLLICDLGMPCMDGREIARHLKLIFPGLPVIIVTGRRLQEIPANLKKLVANIFLKPIEPSSLLVRIIELLGA